MKTHTTEEMIRRERLRMSPPIQTGKEEISAGFSPKVIFAICVCWRRYSFPELGRERKTSRMNCSSLDKSLSSGDSRSIGETLRARAREDKVDFLRLTTMPVSYLFIAAFWTPILAPSSSWVIPSCRRSCLIFSPVVKEIAPFGVGDYHDSR